MLNLLIKKQLFESFRSVFINTKTGKVRSKKSQILMACLFVFVFIALAFSFFGMSMMLKPLFNTEYAWLFYAIFGMVAVILGIFINAFTASSYLFKAKDNDLLLSFPLKAGDILLSKMLVIYILAIAYSGCVWLPICLNGWLNGASFLAVIFDILLLFIIGLFVTAFSSIIGYVIAFVLSKFKNKTITTILSAIAIMALYYFIYFRMETAFGELVNNASTASLNIKAYGFLFYVLAKAAMGDIPSFLIFTAISLVLFCLIYYFLSKNYISLATKSDNNITINKEVKYSVAGNAKSALLRKELKHFFTSPAYMMNMGLGSLFVIGIAVVVLIKSETINELIIPLMNDFPIVADFVPVVIICAIMFILSIDSISCPSISLEGNNLWIIKTLPLKESEIFEAKEQLQLIISGVPAIIASLIAAYCFKLDIVTTILIIVAIILFIDLHAYLGLVFGISRPNLNWSNETEPIKQSLNVLFVMLIMFALVIVYGGLFFLLKDKISILTYLEISIIILRIIGFYLKKWLMNKGVQLFKAL